MPKVLLTRHQIVDHVYYAEGERDVTDDVAKELDRRGALAKAPKAPVTQTKTTKANKPEVKI